MKRKRRVESASGAEDASSFYKRLGLDILTPSSTSGLSQQTELNRKVPVQQTCRTASQTSSATQRPDNRVPQWVQSHQGVNKPNPARTSYSQYTGGESVVSSLSQNVHTGHLVGGHQSDQRHGHDSNRAHPSNYGNWQQSNHANGHHSNHAHGYPSNHVHHPSHFHGQQFYRHEHQSTHSNEYQAHHVQTKPEFVNDGIFRGSRQDPLQIDDRSQPIFDRPVRKQPQVKPVDKYAPPDYLTIMYHPTPTLEDLGLTSYLDSPPSSPRAVSPARDSEQSVTAAVSESKSNGTTATKPTDATLAIGSKQTDTFLPWKLTRITIPDEDVEPAVHLDGSDVVDPRLLFGRRSRGQLLKRENACLGQPHLTQVERTICDQRLHSGEQSREQLAQERDSVCDPRLGLTISESTAHQSQEFQSSALTGPNDVKRKGSVSSTNETERPKKKLCVWSTVAEQYVTDSRQSDNQEAKRDAVYRRYGNDRRRVMRQQSFDTERHQTQAKYQTQSAREESYDEMLARQKARQNERQQNLKPGLQSIKHTNSVSSTMFTVSDNKVPQNSGPTVSLDLFSGMSPFSCWNQTVPGDPRYS